MNELLEAMEAMKAAALALGLVTAPAPTGPEPSDLLPLHFPAPAATTSAATTFAVPDDGVVVTSR